jgi:hypothetical protein
MEVVLIVVGLLVMSGAGLWYLGAAFSESLFWGLTLLVLAVASAIFSVGSAAGGYGPQLTWIFIVAYLILSLTFLFQYWDAVKKPFFLHIFGAVVCGAGIMLGGMSLLSTEGSNLIASLTRSDQRTSVQSALAEESSGPSGGTATFDQDAAGLDAMAAQYEAEKGKGMKLDPRYDQAVRDYQAMRRRETGQSSGSPGGQGSMHGGSSGPNPEPEPLIGKRTVEIAPDDRDFIVPSSELLAASQAAKRNRGTTKTEMSEDPWYRAYRQATRPTIAAWQRVHLAIHDAKHRKDLAAACQELVRASSSLPPGILKGAPDERITFNLTQAYDSLRKVGRDCMAGKMSALQRKLQQASEEMARAQAAMTPFRMKP